MFHNKQVHNLINSLQGKALGAAYQDRTSSLSELLNLDKPASISYGNIKHLPAEICKAKMDLSPPFTSDIFS